jgi:hypothetical protein
MKRILNTSLRSLLALAFVAVCGASAARAQIHDSRVIRARAGGVNFVSGDVTMRREGEKSWPRLSANDELKSGDIVRTGADGRVEVLLNPGSYFRAGGDTMFTLADASLEDLRVAMVRGSAVVEATGYSDLDLSIKVVTPRGVVRIVRSGVYRIDVGPSGVAEVEVLKGRAFVGTTLVKGGKLAREGAYGVEVAKLDKDSRDALDQWSRDRGKELAKANEKLSRRGLNSSLAGLNSSDIFGRDNRANGLWLWNARASCFTFVPFNNYYWQSPYGYSYGTGAYYYPGSFGNGNASGGYTPTTGGGGSVVTAPGAGSGGGKAMPPHEISPPREMPQREMISPAREMSAPREMSQPMSSPSHDRGTDMAPPQRNAPPE